MKAWVNLLIVNTKLFVLIIMIAFVTMHSLQATASQKNAKVEVAYNTLNVTSLLARTTSLQLRVIDPQGQLIFEKAIGGDILSWQIPGNAMDGLYSYEVRLGEQTQNVRSDNGKDGLGAAAKAKTESGTFMLQNGSVVIPTEEEAAFINKALGCGKYALQKIVDFIIPPAYADQVILDDLIVDGSSCIGEDCVNGEAFGFDTLRLKENNLRINFTDTSNSSSFPSNDWRITINDSSNGGASFFGVDDVDAGRRIFSLAAGAPANSIFLNRSGNLGLGTSTPVTELHMVDGNTPTIRLDQDGSSGWATQVWDVAGNETSFFLRDVTNESQMPFLVKAGAPTNSMYIAEDGKVGLGTQTPTQQLHVEGSVFIRGNLELGSSRDIKNNIESLGREEAMQTLAMLRPVKFQYKVSPEEDSVGFIAEDVPGLVATNSRKSISTMDVVAVMAKVVQEQQKTIDDMNKTIVKLQNIIDIQLIQPQSSLAIH